MVVCGGAIGGFAEGARLVLQALLVGAVPVALAGLLLRARVRRGRGVDARWERLLYAAFIFQMLGLALSAPLVVVLVLFGPSLFAAISAANLVFGMPGLRAWNDLRRATVPSAPLRVTP
jgi:hypothetical protein